MWGSTSPPKPRGTKTGQDHYTQHGKYITGTVRAFHEEARAVSLSGGTYTRVPQKDVP